MSATQSTAFPLATEGYDGSYDGDSSGSAVDDNGGASGASTGGVPISHGAMIAIIVVVVAVAALGSK